MKTVSYRVLLREEPEGGYTVTVPTLPGCITYDETIPEAVAMAKEAIELYVESLSIARGYVHKAGGTAARFVPNPFATVPGGVLYRTGCDRRSCSWPL